MRENFLFHRKHRAVAGNKGPAIPAMAYVQRELLQKQLRPRPRDRDGVVTFQLRRRHGFTRELSKGSFPTLSIHGVPSGLDKIAKFSQGHGHARFLFASRNWV